LFCSRSVGGFAVRPDLVGAASSCAAACAANTSHHDLDAVSSTAR
jgi:hypothetical protein